MAHITRIYFSFLKRHGFTLIELLISIIIFATLIAVVVLTFDPLGQIQKGQDVQRQHDLAEIQAALDSYFNDTGCYPTTLSFGSKWSVNKTVYMAKVPQDINCNQAQGICYRYEVDTTTPCPQWNILFSQLNSALAPNYTCALVTQPSCAPNNYADTGVNYCIISGKIDCTYVSTNPVANGKYQYVPPPPKSSSSSSSSQSSCAMKNYKCTGGPPARCNRVPDGTGDYCAANCNGDCL